MGRYITSDPIGLEGGLNTFGYVFGRPANLIDVSGLDTQISIFINGTIFGIGSPVNNFNAAGLGISITGNTGISINDKFDLCSLQFFFSSNVASLLGIGKFGGAGTGVSVGSSDGALPIGASNTDFNGTLVFNAAAGARGVGVSTDFNGDGVQTTSVSMGPSVGEGAMVAGGASQTNTFATPSLSFFLRIAEILSGLPIDFCKNKCGNK